MNYHGLPQRFRILVVIASTQSLGATMVLLSSTNGMGTYTGHVENAVFHATRSQWVGVANMNPSVDAFPDIVVATVNQLIVFFNDGTGSNYTPLVIPNVTNLRRSVQDLGDLNADGFPEIVGQGYVIPNNGNGTFGAKQVFSTGTSIPDVLIANVNGDSHADIVHGAGNDLAVRLGNSSGTFPSALIHPNGSVDRMIVADLDGNGPPDVIAGNYESGYHAYFRSGTPQPKIAALSFTGQQGDLNGAVSMVAADLTGDGAKEIVVSNTYSGRIFVYRPGNPFKE